MSTAPATSPATQVKTCVTCAHYAFEGMAGHRCRRECVVDPVTGATERSAWDCGSERASTTYHKGYTSADPCGPEGKHWKPNQQRQSQPHPAPAFKTGRNSWFSRLAALLDPRK